VRRYQQAIPQLRSRAWLKQKQRQSSLGSQISNGSLSSVAYRTTPSKNDALFARRLPAIVVPANAGIHTPQRSLLRTVSTLSAKKRRHGV
jgi:hypothetical protein